MNAKITNKEVVKLMADNGWFSPEFKPINLISDKEFILLSKDEYEKIIRDDKTNERRWVDNIGDCDNFAFELRAAFGRSGAAVGVIFIRPSGWTTSHAVFFYITEDRELMAIEPQKDSRFTENFYVTAIVMY